MLRHHVTSFRQFEWRRVTLYAERPMSPTISHSCDYDYGSREVSRCDISMTFASLFPLPTVPPALGHDTPRRSPFDG